LNGSCEGPNSSPEAAATPNPSFSAFTITGNGSPTAGAANQLTIAAVDSGGSPVTGVSGALSLTFSGLSAAPDGSLSTVSDKNGTARNVGLATTITFVNGVGSTASSAAVLVAHKAETATLHVTDGPHSTTSPGGAGLALAVSEGADSAYRISAATATPVVGATNTLTIAIVDQYQNPSSFTGTKNITFGGLAAAPDGSLPTVDGIAFGTPTPITFSSPASAALIAHRVENNKLLTATDGTFTAAGIGGTAPTLSPTAGAAAQLGIITQPSATATAGVAFAQQPVIVIQDAFANVVSNSTASVSAIASAGTLQGTTSVNANGANGRATFSGLSLTNVGSVTLTFQSTGLTSTNSGDINVSAGAAVALAWTTQPVGGVYGSPLSTQPVLKTVDQFGNPATSGLLDTMNVTVTVSSGGGAVAGTTNYNIGTSGSNGVIVFTDLATTSAGSKQLTASMQAGLGAPPSGMGIWLKADAASSITTNGSGIVTAWADQSGNGHNFGTTIGTGGNGIRYTNTVVSGRKAVTFNATSATAGTELVNSTYANSSNAISVFVVAKKRISGTADGQFQRVCATLNQGGGQPDFNTTQSFEIDYGTDCKTPRIFRNNAAASSLGAGSFDPSMAYHIDQYIANASVNAFWLATNAGTVTAATGGTVGSFNINRFAVGGGMVQGPGINNPFAGDVCELLVYTADMTSQRSSIETYLRNKWLSSIPITATTATFNVAPATVVPIVTVNNKPYDNTTAATIATRSLSGVVGSDDVNLDASGTAIFSDATVGSGKIVTITDLSLSGTTAASYVLSTTSTNTTADITPRTLTVTASGINKNYDGNTNAAVTLSDDRIGGEDVTTTYAAAGFADKNVANGKPVSVSGISITGGIDGGNYTLGNSIASTTANIAARSLTVTATGINKDYDGTTNATVTLSDDRIGGDDVTTTYAAAGFADKNVGNGKPLSVSGISITGGTDGANYTLGNTTASTTANIAARPLTVTATGINKNYDGTTNATVTLSDDRVSGDDLTTSYTTAGFEDSTPGTNKPVHVFGISITGGTDAGNYALANTTADTTADIIYSTVDIALASSANPSAKAQSVTFTATLGSQIGTPTGSVIFLTNGVPLSTNTVASGVATSDATAALPRGTNAITAQFAGDGSFTGFAGTTNLDQIVTNTPPIAGTAHFQRPSGVALTIKIADLLTNATDVDLDTLNFVSVSATTTNGTALSNDATNVFVQPNGVDDAFTYTVQDGYGGTNSGTVLVSVAATPTQSQVVLSNGVATVIFGVVPGFSYTADRATNVFFTGVLRTWITNAPPDGLFRIGDDFSDIGGTPDQGYYRLRYTP
jgi:hypothetical protein